MTRRNGGLDGRTRGVSRTVLLMLLGLAAQPASAQTAQPVGEPAVAQYDAGCSEEDAVDEACDEEASDPDVQDAPPSGIETGTVESSAIPEIPAGDDPSPSAAFDAAAPVDVAVLNFGPATTYEGAPAEMTVLPASCADMADPAFPGAFAEPVPLPEPDGAPPVPLAAFSRGDDLIRLMGTRGPVRVEASAGDDYIYLVDVGDKIEIAGGSGGDTVVVCSMHGAELHVVMGRGIGPADRFPDVVVIEFSVFGEVPKAMDRVIWIDGFLSVNDRIELRVPPGIDVETLRTAAGRPEEMRVGSVKVFINAGGGFLSEPRGFDASSIVTVTGETQ